MAQAQIEQEVEYFRGHKYVLSNFYYCKLVIDGQKFNTSEQAYQVLKAKFHQLKDVEQELMECHFVSKVKKISEKIKVSAEWIDKRVEVMRKILRVKADQCTTYRKKLLNCKGKIVEAIRGDLFWSAGLDEQDLKNLPMDSWPGQNVLGQLHMEIRDELEEFLLTQSQSKKRTVEWAEFVGKKPRIENKPTASTSEVTAPSYYFETPSLNPTTEGDASKQQEDGIKWIEPSFSFETPNLHPQVLDENAMFHTPIASPIKANEDDAVEEFLASVAAEVDKKLNVNTPPENPNKGEHIYFFLINHEVYLVFTKYKTIRREKILRYL